MKNATPSDIAIKKIIENLKELIEYGNGLLKSGNADVRDIDEISQPLYSRLNKIIAGIEQMNSLDYITDDSYKKLKQYFFIQDDAIFEMAIDALLIAPNGNNKGYVEDIVTGIYPPSDGNYFIKRMTLLLEELKKCVSKEEKAKKLITGLKQPIVWEQITMLFTGNEIEVKQNDRSLGMYSLNDLNFPKMKTDKKFRNVRGFFMSLFLTDVKRAREVLNFQDNNNQKLKSSLTKILCEAFNTNKDPIKKEDGIYKPLFKPKFSGDLRIDEHRSGGELFDNQEY